MPICCLSQSDDCPDDKGKEVGSLPEQHWPEGCGDHIAEQKFDGVRVFCSNANRLPVLVVDLVDSFVEELSVKDAVGGVECHILTEHRECHVLQKFDMVWQGGHVSPQRYLPVVQG